MTDTPLPADESTEAGPAIEAGVHGSALVAIREMVETYVKPVVVGVVDPLTGTHALIEIGKDGAEALPADIFDDYRGAPARRKGTATLLTVDSFIAHVNRFHDDDTIIFANNDRAKPSLTALIDYHRAGAEADPRFGEHRSHFAFPLSDEWQAWRKYNATPMKMVDFARFIEDRIVDVMPVEAVALGPQAERFVEVLGGAGRIASPANLRELSINLQVNEAAVVAEAQNLASGEMSVQFQSEHQDKQGQPLRVPTMFVLGIPVFNSGDLFQIIARFRYRKDGGQLVFFYELWRTDLVFDTAFNEAVEKVGEETGNPVLLGFPEA